MNIKTVKIAPSLLAADFSKLRDEIKRVEDAGCDLLHIDVMDGHFVPNITVGPFIVSAIRKCTKLPLDTHLMIESPKKYIPDFIKAGSDIVTVHTEACAHDLTETLKLIKSLGAKASASIKPATGINDLMGVLDLLDMILVMTVNPGFGGQSFMEDMIPKIIQLRSVFSRDIEVDGGISPKTAKVVVEAGANILVAGTAIFANQNVKQVIEEMRCLS